MINETPAARNDAATPPGSDSIYDVTGDVASLNPRLIAATPAGVEGQSALTSGEFATARNDCRAISLPFSQRQREWLVLHEQLRFQLEPAIQFAVLKGAGAEGVFARLTLSGPPSTTAIAVLNNAI